jgi:amino acid permease
VGYKAYGDSIKEIIIFNLDEDSNVTTFVYILYSILLIVSIPLEHLPAIKTIEETTLFQKKLDIQTYQWKKYVFRVILAIFFIFFVSRIKDIGASIDFFGCLFFTLLGFIAPVYIYETNWKEERKGYEKGLNYFILFFGIICGGIGAYHSLLDMF